jgi:AcrR family transcriptional regulator
MTTTGLPKTKRGKTRRVQILRAAERVFGAKGFAEASISAITREAGTAQGTFYIYFHSKEEVFRELVVEMGQMIRSVLAEAVRSSDSRLDAERSGLRAFLQFVSINPALYRIVEEARFVDPPAYREYLTTLAEAYRRQLTSAAAAGAIRPGDAEVRAWALMGMAKTLGERFVLWDSKRDIDLICDEAFSLIRNGLER